MITKVLCMAALVAIVTSNEYGKAYSSQCVYREYGPTEKIFDKDDGEDNHNFDYRVHPKFKYEYKVEDDYTGDIKSQEESRDGDVVKGRYWLHEPDGSIRTVEYYADGDIGFKANVKHETHQKKDNNEEEKDKKAAGETEEGGEQGEEGGKEQQAQEEESNNQE